MFAVRLLEQANECAEHGDDQDAYQLYKKAMASGRSSSRLQALEGQLRLLDRGYNPHYALRILGALMLLVGLVAFVFGIQEAIAYSLDGWHSLYRSLAGLMPYLVCGAAGYLFLSAASLAMKMLDEQRLAARITAMMASQQPGL